MANNIEKLKEYSPEDAGKRVGWVSVRPMRSQFEERTLVDVVTATVGNSGAWQGFFVDKWGEEHRTPTHEGFFAIAGISTVIMATKPPSQEYSWLTDTNLMYSSPAYQPTAASILQKGLEHYTTDPLSYDNRIWANNQPELIDNLRQLLADAGKSEYYPQLYYWLNGAIARNDEGGVFEGYGIDELLAPDALMAETTKEQLEAARGIAKALHELMEEDMRMRQRLTVFSDIPAADVPNSFTNSRRFAHEHEKAIRDYAAELAVRRTIYLPVGYRPHGRSWPYMDAESADEQVAFGQELNAIKEQNTALADHELGREIAELSARYHYAAAGATRLHDLSTLEART